MGLIHRSGSKVWFIDSVHRFSSWVQFTGSVHEFGSWVQFSVRFLGSIQGLIHRFGS